MGSDAEPAGHDVCLQGDKVGAEAEDMDCGRYALIWTYRPTMSGAKSS